MNTSNRNEEDDYEVGDRFSLPLDNEDYDENDDSYSNNYNNLNNENNTNENNTNENNTNENNTNENNMNENNENYSNKYNNLNNENTVSKINTSDNETTGSEIALLGDDVERYKDDDAFLQDTLMPIMRSYFPKDPLENGEKNILMGVLKHDAIVIVKVKQLMEKGTDNNEDFVEMVEEYTDDEYMDKETIEDTLELTLKYVTGLKSSIDTYVEYEFFCSSIPGYKQFVEEMLQYRVVMRLNRHMFYKELHGYLHKEVYDNYDFNTAIFDFDSEVNEFVKENKRRGRNTTKKPTANKKPITSAPITANNYEEATTGVINANKVNTSRVGSSIFGTANATVGTANATVGTANTTANSTVGTANATANSTANSTSNTAKATVGTATPTLMNQITAAVTPTTAEATAETSQQPTLFNQLATATGFKATQKGGRITPRQGHNSSRFTRRH